MSLTQVTTYNLSTVLKRVKQIINDQTQNKFFWVKAQISKINSDRRGNFYLELIESNQGNVIAKCEANIWAAQYITIKNKLQNDTTDILKDGSEVLCYAAIEYSEIYGLRLQILDFDLSYSLGEIEKRKQETLLYLQNNNLIQLNKKNNLATVIQKIALIASPNTAGFTDFVNQLKTNEYSFDFKVSIYACTVQGDKALTEIIEQIKSINAINYDIIAIVRGGGSKFDLEIFNDLELAKCIAQTKIPVLTGIGHETDISIADIVSYKYLKTPTALAAFIIDRAHQFYLKTQSTYQAIVSNYQLKIKENKHNTLFLAEQIKTKAQYVTEIKQNNLHNLSNKITFLTQEILANEKMDLNKKSNKLAFLSQSSIKNNLNLLKNKATYIEAYTKQHTQKNNLQINTWSNLLKHFTHVKINQEKQRIEKLIHIPEAYHPQQTLNTGYALVRKNGEIITDKSVLKDGDFLEIELAHKTIEFTIKNPVEKIKWKDIPTKVQH